MKYVNFYALMLLWTFLFAPEVKAQNTCPNSDFSMNDFTNWQGRTGTCCPINLPNVGIVAGRHTIMTGTGTDPNTGNLLPVVAPGYTASARVGNAGTGAQADGISYTINVAPDSSNALFLYSYAVVLQDPGHTPAEQPRFEIQVRDQFGNVIPCTFFQVSAAAGIPGFQNFGSVRWKPWEQVGVDLSPYVGSSVTIEVRTGDCSQSGHYGYAYIVAECRPMKLNVTYCENDGSATVTAPSGFNGYQWSTGGTTQSVNIANPLPNTTVTCTLISNSGCNAYLTAVINQTIITPDFNYVSDCNGTVTFTDLTTITNGNATGWSWNFGDGTTSTAQSPVHSYAAGGNYNVLLTVTSNQGCTDTITKQVYVRQSPVAAFNAPQTCGFDVSINNTSTANNTFNSINWDFGNGTYSSAQNPTATYIDPVSSGLGYNYTITLVVENQDNCFDTATQNITLLDIPVADFTFVADCDQSVAFTNGSSIDDGNALNYTWDFGDGNTSTATNPNPTYANGGNHQVQLIASTNFGCADTVVKQVYVRQSPVASFNSPSVCGFSRTFTNTSQANNTFVSYNWDFGNGSSATTANPIHTYIDPETNGLGYNYVVTLIVENQDNCFDTATQNITLWDYPVADFQLPVQACVNELININDVSTVDNSTINTWDWNLGDGTTSNSQNNTHQFASANTYTISLIVTDVNGCMDTVSKNIPVYNNPVANFPIPNACGINVSYQDQSNPNGGAVINGWNWSFGDGNTSNSQNPGHIYSNTGNFNVELIVTNADGCKDTLEQVVVVHELPIASFTFNNVCRYQTVSFTNTSTTALDPIVSQNWTMHDATTYNVANPNHTYNVDGSFPVTLIVSTNFGCSDTVTQNVTIYPLPVPQFTANDVCDLNSVLFNNTSTISSGTIDTYLWEYIGNPSLNNSQTNPSTVFPGIGTYQVQLTAISNFNCMDSIMHSVTVHPNPVAQFNFDDADGCAPHRVQFSSLSNVVSGNIVDYDWSFGNGFSSNMNPLQVFGPGNYDITLIVTTDKGCKDTLTQYGAVTGYPNPIADFENNPSKEDISTPFFQFTNLSQGYTTSYWSFGDGSTSTETHPGHLYEPNEAGYYDVILVVENQYGCADTTENRVQIVGDHIIYIPNSATPNTDGINEDFVIVGTNIIDAELLIFNRWGEKVGHVKGWQNDKLTWNCTDGRGTVLKQDTYSYKFFYTAGSGKKYNLIGHVNIIY